MRTDGRTDMTKLTVSFRNFANVPKNTYNYFQRPETDGCCTYRQFNTSHPVICPHTLFIFLTRSWQINAFPALHSIHRLVFLMVQHCVLYEALADSYNGSQQGALFLNFILVCNYTCFGQTYCPSSGVLLLYSQQLVFVILVMLTVC